MLLASRCRSAPLCPAEVLPARMTQHALAHAQEVAKSCVSEVVTRNQEALDQQSLIHEAQRKYLEDQILSESQRHT